MKRVIVLSICLLATSATFCQMHYGVQLTANLSTANINDEDFTTFSKDLKTLAGANVVAEYELTKKISVRTSLGLLQKGSKFFDIKSPMGGTDLTSTLTTRLNYLEMPWNFVYNIRVRSTRIMLGAGPSFGLGISGKVKSVIKSGSGVPVETEDQVKVFDEIEKGGLGFKKFEGSANVMAGLRLRSGLYVTTTYLYGLTNLSSDNKYKNRGMQLNVGLMF